MSFIILIVCLTLQRFLLFDRYAYQMYWLEAYFHWIIRKVEYVTEGHPLAGILILLMPVLIFSSLFFSLAYHFFGVVVYAVCNFILLWVSIDGRNLIKRAYPNVRAADLFVFTYERLFAVIFWFIVFGPAGLVLYTATISLRNLLMSSGYHNLLFYLLKVKALLDWVPIRLLGLGYAIVGNFSSVSNMWTRHLQTGLEIDSQLAVEYGCAALGLTEAALNKVPTDVIHIINRALWFWLVIIGMFTGVFWLG